MDTFVLGVKSVLIRWTALQLAIEHQESGDNKKLISLFTDIVEMFAPDEPPMVLEELEDYLYDALAAGFDTDVEDGSIELVAKKIMKMHEDCMKGEFTEIQTELAKLPANALEEKFSEYIEVEGSAGSSSDHESDASPEQTPMDIDQEKKEEDNGWTVVVRKKK